MSSLVAALTLRDFLRTDGRAAKGRSDDDSKESVRGRATEPAPSGLRHGRTDGRDNRVRYPFQKSAVMWNVEPLGRAAMPPQQPQHLLTSHLRRLGSDHKRD